MASRKHSLEEQIAARKKQAEDRKIGDNATHIARYLGSHRSLDGKGVDGDEYIFEEGPLRIEYSFGSVTESDGGAAFGHTHIHFNKKPVFLLNGLTSLDCYVPGVWERRFKSLLVRADAKEKEVAAAASATNAAKASKKDRQTRDKWGL